MSHREGFFSRLAPSPNFQSSCLCPTFLLRFWQLLCKAPVTGDAAVQTMESNSKLRRAIAHEAARLLYFREESEYYRAKQKAARRLCHGWVKPNELPSNAEIRDAVQSFARLHEGQARLDALQDMRLTALRMMLRLERFHPRIIGSVFTGHVRRGSDIDLHVFSDSIEAVAASLDVDMIPYDIERKQVRKSGEHHVYIHIHVKEKYPIELTVYPTSLRSYNFRSSVTGKPIEKASIPEFKSFLQKEYPNIPLMERLEEMANEVDPYTIYFGLLLPLENVTQHPLYHPEGDVLYHSLQVFDMAYDLLPYDEEFLAAALLHDIGKGIDAANHVEAGLEALEGAITTRTAWLIAHHMDAHLIHNGTIGSRHHRRLRESESYEELLMLGECDRAGRARGVETSTLEEAIDILRQLGSEW